MFDLGANFGYYAITLAGGLRSLQRFRPVILIELNPNTLERDGCSVRDVVAWRSAYSPATGFQVLSGLKRVIWRDRVPVCEPISFS